MVELSCISYYLCYWCYGRRPKNSEKKKNKSLIIFNEYSIRDHDSSNSDEKTSMLPHTPKLSHIDPSARVHWNPTTYEHQLILDTWSDELEFLLKFGSSIYTYVFIHSPDSKILFTEIHKFGDKWKECEGFHNQAMTFAISINKCIEMSMNNKELIEFLRIIGERHVKFAARGFKPVHWNIFLEAIESTISEHVLSLDNFDEQKRQDATEIWLKFANFIIQQMKRGYVQRLVKEFQSQDTPLTVWKEQHPCFQTSKISTGSSKKSFSSHKNSVIRYFV